MKKIITLNQVFIIMLLIIAHLPSISQNILQSDFNGHWEFQLDSDSSANYMTKKTEWKKIDIPHDWSVGLPFDSINGEGCTGYLPSGIGWYRKHFTYSLNPNNKVYLYFDGVYNHSEYWLNGQKLGYHNYGYSPFYFDVTSYLQKDNQLVVKVNRTRGADSRWYTGSGIYRKVKLIITDRLHIPIWGTFVTTPQVTKEQAHLNIKIEVSNQYDVEKTFDLELKIKKTNSEVVELMEKQKITIQPGSSLYTFEVLLKNPKLWSIQEPSLYELETSIENQGVIVSSHRESFGIRSIKFDADKGFFLNGERVKIKGVCIHHDAGLVGAAVPDEVWIRRLLLLKDMGCNAIRVSHNPASEDFLKLCDELGFLVQDEFFDEWNYPKDKRLNCWEQHNDYDSRGYAEHFAIYAQKDLESTILAHRNHPSIIQWSIGNEIEWTYPSIRKATGFFDNMSWDGNYFWSQPPYSPEKIKEEYLALSVNEIPIQETASQLAKWTRDIDKSRPVIANCILPSVSFVNGYTDQLDVVGFSYRRVMYDYAHKLYPEKPIMGTECLPQWHEWKAAEERDFVAGVFLWTGFDHMGEVHNSWPSKTSPVGLIDQAGFPKSGYHMYKSLWTNKPYIHIETQLKDSMEYLVTPAGTVLDQNPEAWDEKIWYWPKRNEHWNYKSKDSVLVEVISNCELVELFLNNKSLGIKKLSEFPDRKYKWIIPFYKGTIEAKGVGKNENTSASLTTSGTPSKIIISTDKTALKEGEVAHIIVQLYDNNGNEVRHLNRLVNFEIKGGLRNLGVDNGHYQNVQAYNSNSITTSNGRALMIVKATDFVGESSIHVYGEGLKGSMIKIQNK